MRNEHDVRNIVNTSNTGDTSQAEVTTAGIQAGIHVSETTDEVAVAINRQQSSLNTALEWARQITKSGTAILAQQLAGIRSLTSWGDIVEYLRSFGDRGVSF